MPLYKIQYDIFLYSAESCFNEAIKNEYIIQVFLRYTSPSQYVLCVTNYAVNAE